MRWISRVTIVAVLVSCGAVRAGPVLLARYDETLTGGTAPQSLARVQFALQLSDVVPLLPMESDTSLGVGVWWEEGDMGFVDFTAGNSEAFMGFVQRATDGINGRFASLTGFWEGNVHGIIESEDVLFDTSSDMVGFDLDLVRLIVHDVDFEPLMVGPYVGFSVTTDISYEFYGTPIPEPGTLWLVLMGSAAIANRGSPWRGVHSTGRTKGCKHVL